MIDIKKKTFMLSIYLSIYEKTEELINIQQIIDTSTLYINHF